MKILFLDESGDHNLQVVDPAYPLFVLGGIVVDKGYAEGELSERIAAFKRNLFGREDIVLHTSDITRNRNGFEGLKDPVFRARFYDEMNVLMRDLRYSVVACVVRKILGKPVKDDYRIIEEKFRRSARGCIEGFGLIVLPK